LVLAGVENDSYLLEVMSFFLKELDIRADALVETPMRGRQDSIRVLICDVPRD
jgi:hypothetical protein